MQKAEINQAIEDGRLAEVEEDLLKAVDADESEEEATPWIYERLAVVYRKQRLYAEEYELLTRFVARKQP